ncbi:hypothetical protein [Microcoleus sp. B4-D4]|uniref:hypothetical protein n=1 Tax=Microcoleus sp. B4-D4 TaxID=2818667 RepID=UPI002FD0B9C0
MAAIATLTATTLEGQLLQLIEEITNAQIIAVAAAAPGVTVRRIVSSNITDDVAGTKSVSLNIPITVNINATGTAVEAVPVY